MAWNYDEITGAAYTSVGTQTSTLTQSSITGADSVVYAFIAQNGSSADEVSGVTCAGAAMTRIGFVQNTTEASAVYTYLKTGVDRTVSTAIAMTTTGTANKKLKAWDALKSYWDVGPSAVFTVLPNHSIAYDYAQFSTASASSPTWNSGPLLPRADATCAEAIVSGDDALPSDPANATTGLNWSFYEQVNTTQSRACAYNESSYDGYPYWGTTRPFGWATSTATSLAGAGMTLWDYTTGFSLEHRSLDGTAASGDYTLQCRTPSPGGGGRALVVTVVQSGGNADEVSGITCNGVSMKRVADISNLTTPYGRVYIYFLDGITPGLEPTVVMTSTGTTQKDTAENIISAAPGKKIVVANENAIWTSGANPSTTVATTAGTPIIAIYGLHSGLTTVTGTPGTGCGYLDSYGRGALGSYAMGGKIVTPAGSSETLSWAQATSGAYAIAGIALIESPILGDGWGVPIN